MKKPDWYFIELCNKARELMIQHPEDAHIVFYNFILTTFGVDIDVVK